MPETLGQIAHDAYGKHLEGKGASHMPWEHIGDHLQDAWQAAALAVSRKAKKDAEKPKAEEAEPDAGKAS